MKQKKLLKSKTIPPDSPNGRAKALNQIAKTIPLKVDGLPENERLYAQQIHKLLIKYWHKQLSKDEFQAWQVWLSCNQLAIGERRKLNDTRKL
ncbi:MAG: hypothetical protein LKK39_04670 [Oscillospiraceae bacterium]|jgi:hypothetical protein|nr:hypothetical protein [Oscillospiraceae bacterium]MCI2190958.1 hypothetical protein [Oscillospiraceae bacterium]MCI2205942.1 hypothetical protein [Oscillospiraceae bacterium]